MPYLSPSPYPSPGLCQAVWDALGGAKLEVGVRGKIDGAFYTVDANRQFVIPVSAGGDKVAWVRGVWLAAVDFSYEGFKANPRSGQPDITNYLTNAVRSPLGTTVTVSPSLAVGTSVQVYYSKETGVLAQKGEALDGWPVLDLAANVDDYGTALDGDNYILQGLYYAYQLTGQNKYKMAAEQLAEALITWGAQEGNELTFDRKLFNQAGGDGLYNYFGGTGTTFSWDTVADPGGRTGRSLKIAANVLSGGWAGWGWWPSWDIEQSPVVKIIFDLYGDGSGGKITVSSNIDPNKLSSGDISFIVPMLAKDANAWRRYEIPVRDFWKVGNIVFNGDRKDASWVTDFGDGDSTGALVDLIEDNVGPEGYFRTYVKQWNYTLGLTGTYRMVSIGPGSVDSAGTTSLKMALYSSRAMDIDISIDDAFNERWTKTLSVVAGWQAISIPWASFSASGGAPGAYPLTAAMLAQSGLNAFSATGAVDDNTGTNGWHTDTAVPGAWLQVDLGAGVTEEFVQCGLYVGPDYGPCAANYTVQYSDDAATWYDAATGFTPTTNTQWHYKSWTSVGSHRYWRLYLTNTPGYGPWITEIDFFTPAPSPVLDHPITEILIGVYRSYGADSGDIRFDNIRYDEVQTMDGASIMNGLDFEMPSGNHTVYFDNVKIVQTPIDPYPLIPRWTYGWTQKSPGFGGGQDEYGFGVWRGPSAPGYLYMMGWLQFGGSVHSTIRTMSGWWGSFRATSSERRTCRRIFGR
ncbi:MAG: discoidin domain-containing protein [Nitrospirae bacterium]|nr:discoidin domain-containing protein [Nitrospirota bacterium]